MYRRRPWWKRLGLAMLITGSLMVYLIALLAVTYWLDKTGRVGMSVVVGLFGVLFPFGVCVGYLLLE